MSTTAEYKQFLTQDCMDLFAKLQADTAPKFGIMTPQHMVEHLIWTAKSMSKRHGEPDPAAAEKQAKWQMFLQNPTFKHMPKDDAKLGDLKYGSLEEAIAQIPAAVERIYAPFEADEHFKAYNPMMGEIDFEAAQRFHHAHFRYHLDQFGLLD